MVEDAGSCHLWARACARNSVSRMPRRCATGSSIAACTIRIAVKIWARICPLPAPVFCGWSAARPHGSAGMEFVGADAGFAPMPGLSAVGG